jgi:tetratricopeptide (TPR) repeat protein
VILVPLVAVLSLAVPAADEDVPLRRGERALEAGHHAEAERWFRQAIEADPRLADAYRGLARALVGLGRDADAVAALLRAGQGLALAADYDTAIEYLEEAAALAPGSPAVHVALGQALHRADRFERAAAELRRGLELGARDPAVALTLGAALWEAGRVEEAESTYRRMAEAPEPARSAARQSLGGLLLWLGRHDEAARLLAEAAARRPQSAALRFDLARALDGAEHADDAAAAYREALRLAPDHGKAHYRLGLLLDRLGDADASAEHLARFRELHAAEQARTREAGLERARLDEGYELLQRGRLEDAVRHFRSLPASADTLAGLADALSLLGDVDGATAALERALQLDPDRQDVRLRLAEARIGADGS